MFQFSPGQLIDPVKSRTYVCRLRVKYRPTNLGFRTWPWTDLGHYDYKQQTVNGGHEDAYFMRIQKAENSSLGINFFCSVAWRKNKRRPEH